MLKHSGILQHHQPNTTFSTEHGELSVQRNMGDGQEGNGGEVKVINESVMGNQSEFGVLFPTGLQVRGAESVFFEHRHDRRLREGWILTHSSKLNV